MMVRQEGSNVQMFIDCVQTVFTSSAAFQRYLPTCHLHSIVQCIMLLIL